MSNSAGCIWSFDVTDPKGNPPNPPSLRFRYSKRYFQSFSYMLVCLTKSQLSDTAATVPSACISPIFLRYPCSASPSCPPSHPPSPLSPIVPPRPPLLKNCSHAQPALTLHTNRIYEKIFLDFLKIFAKNIWIGKYIIFNKQLALD